MSETKLNLELRRACVKRLYADFDNICFQFRVQLKRPVIDIAELTRQWGLWDPKSRTITLSENLVFGQAWHIVLEVLKHEMAHQYVVDILQTVDQHGPHFKLACKVLGVHPAFASAGTGIGHFDLSGSATVADENILKKVQKLLNLATSSNEHEAWLAAQRVRELLAKYNIDTESLNAQPDFEYKVIDLKSTRTTRVHKMICSILTGYYFVSIVLNSGFNVEQEKETQCIEVYGRRVNVVMAEYVFTFLMQQAESLWSHYKKTHRVPGTYRLSYQVGLLLGFREKLEKENQEWVARDSKAALVLKRIGTDADPALREFISRRLPRLRQRSSGRTNIHEDSFSAGKSDGANIVIRRGVEESHSSQIQFLNS